jgi:hypothetical protein
MDTVILNKGHSSYNGVIVTDKQLADLVGLETYKALYQLDRDLYVKVTNPMLAKRFITSEVKALFSLHASIDSVTIKKNLVMRKVDGPSPETTHIVANLINSTPKMVLPKMTTWTMIIWYGYMLISTLLIVYLFIFFLWPNAINSRIYFTQKFGCPKKWIQTPWI